MRYGFNAKIGVRFYLEGLCESGWDGPRLLRDQKLWLASKEKSRSWVIFGSFCIGWRQTSSLLGLKCILGNSLYSAWVSNSISYSLSLKLLTLFILELCFYNDFFLTNSSLSFYLSFSLPRPTFDLFFISEMDFDVLVFARMPFLNMPEILTPVFGQNSCPQPFFSPCQKTPQQIQSGVVSLPYPQQRPFQRSLHKELTSLPSVAELSLELGLLVDVELYAETVFESIEELAVVQSAVVEIEKALVSLILDDRIPIVYAILELFNRGGFDDDIAAHAEIGKKRENFRRIGPLNYPLLLAVLNHYLFCYISYLFSGFYFRLGKDFVLYMLTDDLASFLVEFRGVHHEA